MQTPRLLIELVPQGQWGANLRSELPRKEWDHLRKATYENAGYRCEVCGGKGRRHPVECHEIWHYEEETKVQKLTGLIALCPPCHEVKHFGRAENEGHGGRAQKHLMKVNGWSRAEADQHIREAFSTWDRRSREKWTLDLSWLENPPRQREADPEVDVDALFEEE